MRIASRLPRLRKTPRRVVSELLPGVGPRCSDTTQRGVVHGATRMQNGFKSQVRGGLDMRTILIAHHDQAFAEQLTSELREGGYRVIDCAGPWPPELRCIRCDKGYCPLTESADLMIYDPDLTGLDKLGQPYNLAVDSARAHPEVPMLLAWAPAHIPDAGTLRAIKADAPAVHAAARQPAARLRQIHDLLAASSQLEMLR